MPARPHDARVRVQRVLWLALAAVAVWHLAALAYIVVTRLMFPFDINWLDGGSLYQAHRIAHGEPLYITGHTGFVPYPYPPIYFALVAGVGRVTGGVGYAGARLVSILSYAGVAFVAARAVYLHASARHVSPRPAGLIALATGALVAAGYPATAGAYDGVRPDALAAAFAGAAVIVATSPARASGGPRARSAVASAVWMTLALYTKQTHVVLALALGVLFFVSSRRSLGWLYFVTLGALSVTGFFALERATDGAFASWLFGLRHHAFDYARLAEGTERVVVGAPHLVLVALLASTHWHALSPRSRGWVVACAATLPAAIVPYAKAAGATNNFAPIMLLAAPTAALVLLDVLTPFYRRLGVPALAAALAGLLAGKIYEGDDLRPTAEMQRYAHTLVRTVAALDGDVISPIHVFLPVAAGHFEEQAPLFSVIDAEAARVPGVSVEGFVDYVRTRKPRWIILSNVGFDGDILRSVLGDDYTLAREIDAPKSNDVFLAFPQRIYVRTSVHPK